VKPLTVARDLQRRRARERTGLFLAEGVRCVEELIASPLAVQAVIISSALAETERGERLEATLRESAGARGLEIVDVTDAELGSVAGTETSQGIVAIARQPERSFENIDPFGIMLILDGVQDPGNVGTILRTAQAFGVAATIALPGTADIWNPKVVRSAMGALFSHRAFHASETETMDFLSANAIPIWTTAVGGTPVSSCLRAGSGVAIVVGNEANGVSSSIAATSTKTIGIPISGVESLNVAVATGIVLYALTTA
jgi:TrmH family RNA methyltransferase